MCVKCYWQLILKYWPWFQDVMTQLPVKLRLSISARSFNLDVCWTTAISSYNCQTPYKGCHGRGLLFHWCLSLLGGSRVSTCLRPLLFPPLLLHLLLEHLHEAAVVSEHISSGHRDVAGCRCGAAGRGRRAPAAGVAAAAVTACLRFAVCALWIHVSWA